MQWVLTLLLVSTVATHAETPADAIRAMVEAERNFFQTGQEKGTRAAFLEFLAPDAIVFRPGPLNGQEVWSKRQETGLDLVWEPTFAAISRSGDFGYDTGPSKWRANKLEKTFTGFGHFVSIWKKQKDGSWKVALDCGIEDIGSDVKPPLQLVTPKGAAKGTSQSLEEAQKAFIATAKLDFTKAFRQFGSNEVRLYRNGSFPTIGKKDGPELLGPELAGVTLEIMNGEMSNAGDLAYCYGKYFDGRTAGGYFLQVWQTDATGTWKLVLEWQQPRPIPR
ncbi:MAG TPA: nuclear transport factor 2 family protein [Chthoniobacterales bacterium]|nr:nuclear transport factor 2 family protein [Chthoniobacterales bacterium]